MRHIVWLFAIAIAILVVQVGKDINNATPSVGVHSTDAMHISQMHRHADKNMPVMMVDNLF